MTVSSLRKPAAKTRVGRSAGRFGQAFRVVRSGLHEQAAERLRAVIVRGDLAPGAPLNEVELSEALGISRTPLREAIKLLAQQGLVELRANRSSCVRPLRPAEIRDLFEALAGIERLAIELASARITPDELARLRALQDEIETLHGTGSRQEYSAANAAVHRQIVAASRNASLVAVHAGLLSRAEQARAHALRFGGRWEQSVAEHRAVLDALASGDATRAGRLLAEHVAHTAEAVVASLSAAPATGLEPNPPTRREGDRL